MIRLTELKLPLSAVPVAARRASDAPSETDEDRAPIAHPVAALTALAAQALKVAPSAIESLHVFKRSFDARKAELLAVYIADISLTDAALEAPLLRGPRFKEIDKLLNPLEEVLGGSIKNENGRFYLLQKGSGKFEISLVAEGFRKLGTIAYLLANGSLSNQSILFWDEPETNLNPAYMSKVAEMLVRVANNGTQVFIATHSLFMLRELSMMTKDVKSRFFALSDEASDFSTKLEARSTLVTQGDSAEDIMPIAALDAEIEQGDRYMNSVL